MLPPDFLDFVDVFHGDLTCCRLGHHGGKTSCDKERLVKPMLGLLRELYRDRDTDPAARVMFREIEPQLKRLYPATFEYVDDRGHAKTMPLFGELVDAAFYYADHADDAEKRAPKFVPGANAARMGRAPTGVELKEVMQRHGTYTDDASETQSRSRPIRRLSTAALGRSLEAPLGDGVGESSRHFAETRTQKKRRGDSVTFPNSRDENV